MKLKSDKTVIEFWLRLYNRLRSANYSVVNWPDDDSSRQNIDAFCKDKESHTLAIEHTLIEPFEGEKNDADRFLKTLASLENDRTLVLPGYLLVVSQPIGSVPIGIDWNSIPSLLRPSLAAILPTLPEGDDDVPIENGKLKLTFRVKKLWLGEARPGKFLTARIFPGEPEPSFIIRALNKKIPKLKQSRADQKILLLEKDSVAGTIERKLASIQHDEEIFKLLRGVEIWTVNTAGLGGEGVIFTNRVILETGSDRTTICSLNIETNDFWQPAVHMQP
jgi:hypothetical protein